MLSKIVNSSVLQQLTDDDAYYNGIGKAYLSASTLKNYLTTFVPEPKTLPEHAMFIGSMVHYSVLEETKFNSLQGDLNSSELQQIIMMQQALKSDPRVRKILKESQYEVPVIGELEGVRCKAKCDILGDELWDIKTTSSIYAFHKNVYKYGYHIANHHYFLLTGKKMKYIVVDKSTYKIHIVIPTDEFYLQGRLDWIRCIVNYKKSKDYKWEYVGHTELPNGRYTDDVGMMKVDNNKTYINIKR